MNNLAKTPPRFGTNERLQRLSETTRRAVSNIAVRLAKLVLHDARDDSNAILLSRLFPHVNFARLRLADAIRIPLQLIWLALLRPQQGNQVFSLATVIKTTWNDSRRLFIRVALSPITFWLYLHRTSQPVQNSTTSQKVAGVSASKIKYSWLKSTSSAWFEQIASNRLWVSPIVRGITFTLAALLAGLAITTPFALTSQLVYLGCLWVVAMLLSRLTGKVPTLLLMMLSVIASTRYMWWRVSTTLNWDEPFDLFWGLGLIAAESYVWIILLMGYLQTAWPLRRALMKLPANQADWPTVDLFIPTYNEPLSVLKPTVFAAMGIDWPADKLNIYILDDGRRPAFREFAEQMQVGYLTRPDNAYAKAGNLNHALKKTNGEFVAIFDCDHIPTRGFLQMTMGWMVEDPKMALLQTPHHFFSPDPFERNLDVFRAMPNEGELFYGIVQDGNDLWNATFFCGSCAVIRRDPLEQVGGVAVETVTEDAHTALKIQRLGYKSAYLNVPLAAGLATESLSSHIGQRIRWARGMAQIFRLDNPFFGKGLSWAQRICYGNSMVHFFNGGPRLIFLTAPLAFLIFHAYVIYAPALMVLLFVLPHMAHASITNSRIQGKFRHSFWAEVYETVLAWYIVRPTAAALINPHKGKFNVTAKGGLVEERYFDWDISRSYIVMVGLNLIGITAGIARLIWGPADEISTTWLNLTWTLYNLLILGAAISVALEATQQRRSHRVAITMPALVHLPNGKIIQATTVDFSDGGSSLTLREPLQLAHDEAVSISLWRGNDEHCFAALVATCNDDNLRVRWDQHSLEQQKLLVQCTFARADTWVSWSDGRPTDRPLAGLVEVLLVGLLGYRRMIAFASPSFVRIIRSITAVVDFTGSLLPRHPTPPAITPRSQ